MYRLYSVLGVCSFQYNGLNTCIRSDRCVTKKHLFLFDVIPNVFVKLRNSDRPAISLNFMLLNFICNLRQIEFIIMLEKNTGQNINSYINWLKLYGVVFFLIFFLYFHAVEVAGIEWSLLQYHILFMPIQYDVRDEKRTIIRYVWKYF